MGTSVSNIRSKFISRFQSRDKLLGMTTQKEQAYYSTIAKDFAGYPGLIVDLGCWLGSTSISLAKGVNISKEHGEEIHHEQIHAFDRFVWTDKMNRYNRMLDKKIRPGDSFLDETKKRIASHQNLIKLHEVDLVSFTWQDPRPIKILLVDAMKSSTLTSAIAKSFYPALKPNSVVIQQDFKHFNEPYIHVLHFKLRDHFRLEENVENSTTVAFRLTKKNKR